MEYNESMLIKYVIISVSFLFFSCSTLQAQIYDGSSSEPLQLSQVVQTLKPGTILVVGEVHGQEAIRDQHLSILRELRTAGAKVSVGMEFFNYTDQKALQSYRAGEITEEQFKSTVKWSGFDFGLYRPQVLFPEASLGEGALGLNMPRSVTQVISKSGLQGLTTEQLRLMPPDFEVGRSSYRTRFFELMSDHVPQEKLENYFVAQSTWDDTMAWQSVEFVKNNLDHVFVIIVGEFHVQYGGGLPDRLQKRLEQAGLAHKIQIKTVSQIWTQDLTDDEIKTEIAPSPIYGSRADFIFLATP